MIGRAREGGRVHLEGVALVVGDQVGRLQEGAAERHLAGVGGAAQREVGRVGRDARVVRGQGEVEGGVRQHDVDGRPGSGVGAQRQRYGRVAVAESRMLGRVDEVEVEGGVVAEAEGGLEGPARVERQPQVRHAGVDEGEGRGGEEAGGVLVLFRVTYGDVLQADEEVARRVRAHGPHAAGVGEARGVVAAQRQAAERALAAQRHVVRAGRVAPRQAGDVAGVAQVVQERGDGVVEVRQVRRRGPDAPLREVEVLRRDAGHDLALHGGRARGAREAERDGIQPPVAVRLDAQVLLHDQREEALTFPRRGFVGAEDGPAVVRAVVRVAGQTSLRHDRPRLHGRRGDQDAGPLGRGADAVGEGAPGPVVALPAIRQR